MKALGIILLTAIIFAVIVVGALFGVLGYINEETRKRCGNCMFFDRGNLSKKGEYIKGCEKHVRKYEESE